jgi:hypothetical protein
VQQPQRQRQGRQRQQQKDHGDKNLDLHAES